MNSEILLKAVHCSVIRAMNGDNDRYLTQDNVRDTHGL